MPVSLQNKPSVKAIRGKPRPSAGQGRFTNANLHQLAAPPAWNRAYAMFTLTFTLRLSYKQVAHLIVLLLMLFPS